MTRLAVIIFRHEGHRATLGPGNLLDPVLDDRVIVGRIHRIGVAVVHLFLTGIRLALGFSIGMPAPYRPFRTARITSSSLVVWKMW